MTRCNYIPAGDGVHCSVCGDVREKPVRRFCYGTPTTDEPTPGCPCKHRGPIIATITGRVAGLGCAGKSVDVYRCEVFNEAVIVHGKPPCLDTLSEQVPGATGRTCRDCKVPMQRKETESDMRTELYHRARSWPASTAAAPGVTLACIDCVNPNTAVTALDMSRRGCNFARVVLFSDEPPDALPAGIEWVKIPELSFKGYQQFCLKELWKWTHTPHVLTIEADGYILRPEKWNPDWLQYDYIGAPWPKARYSAKSRVGNSGCCLRSRRLLIETDRLSTPERMKRHYSHNLLVDVFTCYDIYDDLIRAGMKFAPPEVAAQFAVEKRTEFASNRAASFGYHGKQASPTAFVREESHRLMKRTAWRNTGGKLRVVYNRYTVADAARQAELDRCWQSLFANKHIDELIEIDGRPTFQDMFDQANETAGDDDITLVVNSDCHLDETAADFGCMTANEFWCLTRHENGRNGWELWDVPFSQDGWAWRGNCRIKSAYFLPGTMGCDSVLAYHAYVSGYRVRNPAKSIRLCHHHAGEQRTALERLPGPYVYLSPHDVLQEAPWQLDLNPPMYKGPAVWRPK
jgi:hypothetical protein